MALQQSEEEELAAAAVTLAFYIMKKNDDKLAAAALAIADDDIWEDFECEEDGPKLKRTRQHKQTTMRASIMIRRNSMSDWCLKRLARENINKKQLLMMYQSVPVYFACLGVKRSKTMSAIRRREEAVKAYKEFTAAGWLQWLMEECDHQVPPWLDIETMGKTTINGKNQALYNPNDEALWRRYADSGREIRARFNQIVDTFLVGKNDDELPSGQQDDDLMEYLHQKLWMESTRGTKIMSESEFLDAKQRGEEMELLEQVQRDCSKNKESKQTNANPKSDAAASKQDSPAPQGPSSPHPAVPDQGGDTSPPNSGETQENSEVSVVEQSKMVRVLLPMPDNYVHVHALVFALFGKRSVEDMRDPDLDLAPSCGPPNKKPRASGLHMKRYCSDSSSPLEQESSISSRAIKMMVRPGETQGRVAMTEALRKEAVDDTAKNLKQKLAKMIDGGSSNPETAEICSHVKDISVALTNSVAMRKRESKIAEAKIEYELLKSTGDLVEAEAARLKLLGIIRSPFNIPAVSADPTSAAPVTALDVGIAQGGNSITGGAGVGSSESNEA